MPKSPARDLRPAVEPNASSPQSTNEVDSTALSRGRRGSASWTCRRRRPLSRLLAHWLLIDGDALPNVRPAQTERRRRGAARELRARYNRLVREESVALASSLPI